MWWLYGALVSGENELKADLLAAWGVPDAWAYQARMS